MSLYHCEHHDCYVISDKIECPMCKLQEEFDDALGQIKDMQATESCLHDEIANLLDQVSALKE